jgi:tRNA(adenine34) deaminase
MPEQTEENDILYMKKALTEAGKAFDEDEIPIGAIVVYKNKIIGKGYNQTEKLCDVTAHAEMLAISAAENYIGAKYLEDCTMYVTIEPCVMCAGAIKNSRISRLVYGASEPKYGFTKFISKKFHDKIEIKNDCMETDCRSIMQEFFKDKR